MSTVPEKTTYNLPGFGLIRIHLFPCARRVYQFLDDYGHLRDLRDIHQLGPLTEVFPGAHHTRYEYLMAQLALITELCYLEGHLPAGLSLGRERDTFGEVTGSGKSMPSNGEVLMVFALLGNIGHLPSTFAGERALLKHLRDHGPSRSSFRSGLPAEDRPRFDQVLESFQIYHVAYYTALFLLNRYRRKANGSEFVDFCQAVIRSYLTTASDDSDQALAALWRLYRSIRRITYLSLDSLYTPVPFSLDLSSLFVSLEHYLTDVFSEGTTFQLALDRLEGVMGDTIYLAPASQMEHTRCSEDALALLASDPPESITSFRELLSPGSVRQEVFAVRGADPRERVNSALLVQLNYDVDPAMSVQVMPDPVEWERGARSRVGLRSCRFAADLIPARSQLKVSAALFDGVGRALERKIAFRAAKQLIDLSLALEETISVSPQARWDNGRRLLTFLSKAALGPEKQFRFRAMPVGDVSPALSVYGSTRAARRVDDYRQWVSGRNLLDADGVNEVSVVAETLRKISYQGAVLAFVGSTEVIFGGHVKAEFDGLIYLLSRDVMSGSVIIVEAKNVTNGNTIAEAALHTKMATLGIGSASYRITHIGRRGAFASLNF